MVRVRVYKHKCTSPRDCRRCLEVCPEGVFMMYPETLRRPGRRAGSWVIAPARATRCTGCMVCVGKCPNVAISVVII